MIRNPLSKPALAIIGIALALVLVETGLRTAGGLLSLGREMRNRRGLDKDGVYRILCLGESTTQNQWPPLLEEELNKQQNAIRFKAIDLGLSGTSSGQILSQLEKSFDTFKPHMVVVMMGINDGEWVWKNPTEYDDTAGARWILFFKNTRLNKLATYIYEGLKNSLAGASNPSKLGQIYRERGDFGRAENAYEAAIKTDPNDYAAHLELGNLYFEKGMYEKAEEAFKIGAKINPRTSEPYIALANLYREIGSHEMAVRTYEAAIKIDPTNPWLYNNLGNLCRDKGDRAKAERMYETAITIDPGISWIHIVLGYSYFERGAYELAERTYKAAIKAGPDNPTAYRELAKFYRRRGDHKAIEKMYADVIKADPHKPWAYLEMAKIFNERGDTEKEERFLLDGFAAADGTPQMSGALTVFYLRNGKKELADKYRRASYLPPETILNYQKLRDRVLKRGAKLVCMQYPLREASSLEDILGTDQGIVFVENKMNFEVALKTHPIGDIFVDMFGGDFGHCTELGNRLIAENLSRTILREAIGREN